MAEEKEFTQSSEEKVSTKSVKCEGCGANMVFDPETQMLYCPHCGTKVDLGKKEKAEELDILGGFSKDRKWEEDKATVFHCKNCGANVVLSKGETAKTCPFCGTAHVEESKNLLGIKPNAVMPFILGVENALLKAKEWAKKRLFAPSKFKRNIKTDNFHGVYMPSFTFDSHTTSYYEGKIGTTHTRTVGSGKNRRTETYTVWRNIAGTYYDNIDDLLITAGSKFTQKEMDKLSPFDTNNSAGYSEEYLLGFMAYHYDRELTDCWTSAKSKIDKLIERGILSQYHYDKVAYLNVSTKHERVTYKYVMLPVYLGNFNYNKKVYNFYVNGTTGKVYGKTPLSIFRVSIAVILGLAVVAGICYLFLKS